MNTNDPDDPVAMYLHEVANVKPLSKNEETELFQRLGREGNWDEKAKIAARRLIESQLEMVVTIAERHSSAGIPVLDLIQEGNIGLLNAVRSFAEMPTGEFSAHAAACIEGAISKLIAQSKRNSRVVVAKWPYHQQRLG